MHVETKTEFCLHAIELFCVKILNFILEFYSQYVHKYMYAITLYFNHNIVNVWMVNVCVNSTSLLYMFDNQSKHCLSMFTLKEYSDSLP